MADNGDTSGLICLSSYYVMKFKKRLSLHCRNYKSIGSGHESVYLCIQWQKVPSIKHVRNRTQNPVINWAQTERPGRTAGVAVRLVTGKISSSTASHTSCTDRKCPCFFHSLLKFWNSTTIISKSFVLNHFEFTIRQSSCRPYHTEVLRRLLTAAVRRIAVIQFINTYTMTV